MSCILTQLLDLLPLNFFAKLYYILFCGTVISFGYMSWVVFKTSTLIFSKKGALTTHILETELQAFQKTNIICGELGSKTTKKQMKTKHFQMCKGMH